MRKAKARFALGRQQMQSNEAAKAQSLPFHPVPSGDKIVLLKEKGKRPKHYQVSAPSLLHCPIESGLNAYRTDEQGLLPFVYDGMVLNNGLQLEHCLYY
jgi:hypothetical protein